MLISWFAQLNPDGDELNRTKRKPDTESRQKNVILKKWLNIRRKRFWVIVLILLYTLLGFFAAPRLIKHNVIELVKEDLGKNTRILLELAVAAK